MGEDARYIVEIGTDLLDLAPVLMDSLSQELEEMKRATAEADFSLVREKAHSSRGAALTFGFDIYASELVKVTEAAKKEDADLLQSLCNHLKSLLDSVGFKAK